MIFQLKIRDFYFISPIRILEYIPLLNEIYILSFSLISIGIINKFFKIDIRDSINYLHVFRFLHRKFTDLPPFQWFSFAIPYPLHASISNLVFIFVFSNDRSNN